MQIFVKETSHREASLLDTLQRAGRELIANGPEREALLCQMFGATRIHERSSVMAHGWERPCDVEIQSAIALLASRKDRISLLEIGAGSTWGTGEANFGVPGLARIIKFALPTQTRMAICDRELGYDIFFHAKDGALLRVHYSDSTTPKFLAISDMRHDGTFIPAATPFIELSVTQDPIFSEWLRWHEKTYGVNFISGANPLFIRPKLDPEIEGRLFGVRVVPTSVDYLNLTECLTRAGEHERYDLLFGRHLLPQYFPSRINRLKQTLPDELAACANNWYVQFDRCFFGDDDYADLVFRHHDFVGR